MKLLVVEDEARMVELLRKGLSKKATPWCALRMETKDLSYSKLRVRRHNPRHS